LAQTGVDVLSVDWRVNLADAKARFGGRVALQGNINPDLLLGAPEVIVQAVRDAVQQTGGAGHILNLGHGILPNTPVENALTFIRAGQTASLTPPEQTGIAAPSNPVAIP
jgi:uroporphyrinogen decarboxylase